MSFYPSDQELEAYHNEQTYTEYLNDLPEQEEETEDEEEAEEDEPGPDYDSQAKAQEAGEWEADHDPRF